MSKKGRNPPELTQEAISRNQFMERCEEYGWPAELIERDLGEDILVRIYDRGQSSGLSFMAQLKSSRDLSTYGIRGEQISYRFRVEDIEHWEDTVPPLVMVLWDIEQRHGYWITVAEAVDGLDDRSPGWQSQQTVAVHVPLANSTDNPGLKRLRAELAEYCFPSISRGRPLEFNVRFIFPKTAEGVTARRELEEHYKTGKAVETDGQFIDAVEFPDWWTRLYGEQPDEVATMKMEPRPAEQSMPVKIEMLPEQAEAASIDYVELRQRRGGTEEASFSNEGRGIPLRFHFVFNRADRRFTMSVKVKGPGADVCETLQMLRFIRALAAGGQLRLTFLGERQVLDASAPPGLIQKPPDQLMGLLDKLCLIQEEMGQILSLPSDWSISEEDARTAEELANVIRTGRATLQNMALTLRLDKDAILAMLNTCRTGRPVQLTLSTAESESELLGVKIPLGPATFRVTATLEVSVDNLKEEAEQLTEDQTFPVRFVTANVFEEFANWVAL